MQLGKLYRGTRGASRRSHVGYVFDISFLILIWFIYFKFADVTLLVGFSFFISLIDIILLDERLKIQYFGGGFSTTIMSLGISNCFVAVRRLFAKSHHALLECLSHENF